MTDLEQRVAALEALMKKPCAKCQPEPHPRRVNDDLVEATAYADREWGGLDHTQGNYAAKEAYLAALRSRPKPSGEPIAQILRRNPDQFEVLVFHPDLPDGKSLVYLAPPPAKPRLLTGSEVRDAVFAERGWNNVADILNAILQGETK